MASVNNKYETVMIFNIQQGEEPVKALVEKFKGLIAENGVIADEEDWGKRRLAYPIDDEIEGYYYMVHFTSGPEFLAELDRVYKITDGVLRTLTVRVEEPKAPKAGKKEPDPAPQPAEEQPLPKAEE